MQRRFCNLRLRREEGIYIPMFAGILVALLLIAGLVIDSANLYLKRDQLQLSADLAVQAGVGFRILKGWAYFHGFNDQDDAYTPENTAALTTYNVPEVPGRVQELRDVVVDTFRGDFPGCTPETPVYDHIRDTVSMTASCPVPLLLLTLVPGFGSKLSTVKVSARAQLSPATVELMMDHSGSMRCPGTDPSGSTNPCACRVNDNLCQTAYSNGQRNRASPKSAPLVPESRIFSLNRAARRFASFFNPHRDRIGIVRFQTVAETTFSLHAADGTIRSFGSSAGDLQHFYQAIDTTDAQGNTNMSDALEQGLLDIRGVQSPRVIENVDPKDDKPFVGVLFTDGAPSAATFTLSNPGPALSGGNKNWLNYSIEWFDGTTRWHGPSPLVHMTSGINYLNFTGGAPPPGAAICGTVMYDTSALQKTLQSGTQKCLNSWQFAPWANFGDSTRRVAGNISASTPGEFWSTAAQASPLQYEQQYYHAAIERGDLFRRRGGQLFTIGFGKEALATGNADPYQDPDNDFTRKAFFLRRLAFDIDHAAQDPQFELRASLSISDPSDPRHASASAAVSSGYEQYRSYADVRGQEPEVKAGLYEGTNDPGRIHSIFEQLAKRILMRLTQ